MGRAASHRERGWERFTDAIVAEVNAQRGRSCSCCGAAMRRRRRPWSTRRRHLVLKAPHPSPLSAHSGFFGCRHFSQGQRLPRKQRARADRLGVAGSRLLLERGHGHAASRQGQRASRFARRSGARLCAEPAARRALPGALRRARVHLAVPGHRPARFRPSRHRLCARRDDRRDQEPQAVPRRVPQPLRLPRGRDRRHRPAAGATR